MARLFGEAVRRLSTAATRLYADGRLPTRPPETPPAPWCVPCEHGSGSTPKFFRVHLSPPVRTQIVQTIMETPRF